MGNSLGSKGLPYTPTSDVAVKSGFTFQQFDGVSTADKDSEVSIFKFDKRSANGTVARPSTVAMAQNYLRRLKTLRHPHCLRLLDSMEDEASILMVTERVQPLSSWLAANMPGPTEPREDFDSGCVWGVYCLAEALAFLSGDGHLAHGNLHPDSVFVTKGGSWKLGGFELCMPAEGTSIPDSLLTENDAGGPCPDVYKSPERAARDWGSVAVTRSAGCLDAFALGVLLARLSAQNPLRSHEDVTAAAASAPSLLRPVLAKLLASSPRARPADFAGLLRGSEYLRHPLVGCMVFLDALALKEPADKQRFFRSLPSVLPRVPDRIAKYRLLPSLLQALEYGAAGGGGTVVLQPILEIGTRLSPAEFTRDIVPTVVRLFSSTDRATRVQLLHHLPNFIDRLTDELINGTIFAHVANGFADTNAVLREATVKAAVPLAPRLSDAGRSVLLKHLKRTAGDAEPALRVNTTICIGRIAHAIPDAASREDILTSVFLRALRDPFPAARVAALRALSFCVGMDTASGSSAAGGGAAAASGSGAASAGAAAAASAASASIGYWGAELLAKRVVPAAAFLCTDSHGEARDAAFTLLEAGAAALRRNSERMWTEERARAAAADAAGASAGTAGDDSVRLASASSGIGAAGAAAGAGGKGAAGKAAEAVAGALGWAVSSLASRIIPSGEIGHPAGGAGAVTAGSGASVSSVAAGASAGGIAAGSSAASTPTALGASVHVSAAARPSVAAGGAVAAVPRTGSGTLGSAAAGAVDRPVRSSGLGGMKLSTTGGAASASIGATANASSGSAGGNGWDFDAFGDDDGDSDVFASAPAARATAGPGHRPAATGTVTGTGTGASMSGASHGVSGSSGSLSMMLASPAVAGAASVPVKAVASLPASSSAFPAKAQPLSQPASVPVPADSGWGDDAWGSLLGDTEPALPGGSGSSSGSLATAAVPKKSGFVLSAGDDEPSLAIGLGAKPQSAAPARAGSTSASVAAGSSGNSFAGASGGALKLGGAKKLGGPGIDAAPAAPAASARPASDGWEDW